MNDFKLIELVRPHKCIYDAKNEYYKDANIRENVWKEISDEMKQPSVECKNRWKNIRDTFRKNKKRQKLPTGSSTANKSRKWHLEGNLEFLNQVENERQTVTNTQEQKTQSDNMGDKVDVDQIQELEGNNIADEYPEEEEVIEDGEGLLDIEHQRKRQNLNSGTKKNTSAQILELFQKNSKDRQDFFMKSLEKEQETPIDLFFSSMAGSVKKLSEERQIRAKMQVSQMVGQLELEEYASRQTSVLSCHSYCTTPNEPLLFQSMNNDLNLDNSVIITTMPNASTDHQNNITNFSLSTNVSGSKFQ